MSGGRFIPVKILQQPYVNDWLSKGKALSFRYFFALTHGFSAVVFRQEAFSQAQV